MPRCIINGRSAIPVSFSVVLGREGPTLPNFQASLVEAKIGGRPEPPADYGAQFSWLMEAGWGLALPVLL
jgi:hypothetical protein